MEWWIKTSLMKNVLLSLFLKKILLQGPYLYHTLLQLTSKSCFQYNCNNLKVNDKCEEQNFSSRSCFWIYQHFASQLHRVFFLQNEQNVLGRLEIQVSEWWETDHPSSLYLVTNYSPFPLMASSESYESKRFPCPNFDPVK